MKAASIHSVGSADTLTLEDVPVPRPQGDEVLVKVREIHRLVRGAACELELVSREA